MTADAIRMRAVELVAQERARRRGLAFSGGAALVGLAAGLLVGNGLAEVAIAAATLGGLAFALSK